MDLELATVARARVDFANEERAAEAKPRGAIDVSGELGEGCLVDLRRRFGQRTMDEALEEHPTHLRSRR